MPVQRLEAIASAHIPEPHRLIMAAAHKNVPIGTEIDRAYPVRVPIQRPETITGLGIPEPDRAVIAAAGNRVAVGAEGDAPYLVTVTA